MNRKLLTVFTLFLAACNGSDTASQATTEQSIAKETTIDYPALSASEQMSYAIGYLQTKQVIDFFKEIDKDVFLQGATSATENKEPVVPLAELETTVRIYMEKKRTEEQAQQQQANTTADSEKNLAVARAFLAENGKKAGVITTDSGLQYIIDKKSDATNEPTHDSIVTVHYVGTLLDGTEFDSSRNRNEPSQFPLNGVIKGWQEGLLLMSVGDIFTFYIAPELGYGESGTNSIPANSLLKFEVELIDIAAK